jgi:hypothetical protein
VKVGKVVMVVAAVVGEIIVEEMVLLHLLGPRRFSQKVLVLE